jgi:hypothetical protein
MADPFIHVSLIDALQRAGVDTSAMRLGDALRQGGVDPATTSVASGLTQLGVTEAERAGLYEGMSAAGIGDPDRVSLADAFKRAGVDPQRASLEQGWAAFLRYCPVPGRDTAYPPADARDPAELLPISQRPGDPVGYDPKAGNRDGQYGGDGRKGARHSLGRDRSSTVGSRIPDATPVAMWGLATLLAVAALVVALTRETETADIERLSDRVAAQNEEAASQSDQLRAEVAELREALAAQGVEAPAPEAVTSGEATGTESVPEPATEPADKPTPGEEAATESAAP